MPEGISFDLHVLGPPPAFVLSQDQTLRRDLQHRPRPGLRSGCSAAPRLRRCVCSRAFREPAPPLGCGEAFGSPGAEAPGGPAYMPDHVLTDIASGHAARADARTRCASVSSVFKKQSCTGDYCGTGQNRPGCTDGTAIPAAAQRPRQGWLMTLPPQADTSNLLDGPLANLGPEVWSKSTASAPSAVNPPPADGAKTLPMPSASSATTTIRQSTMSRWRCRRPRCTSA